jgi:hypothetical protein
MPEPQEFIAERTAQVPLDAHQACYVTGRTDSRGYEQGEKHDRPWLVLSDQETHDERFFIGCAITEALKRFTRTHLVPDPGFKPPLGQPSYIDIQQLWSFPFERDCTDDPVKTLRADAADGVQQEIGARLVADDAPHANNGPVVGRIVWVDLLAGFNVTRSDLAVFRRKLLKLDVKWRYEDTLLMCVVVASDQPERRARKNVYPLITVVPLIRAPKFQKENDDNPKVSVQTTDASGARGKPVSYTALTQLLFTVDYREKPRHYVGEGEAQQLVGDKQRVFLKNKNGSLDSWIIPPAELTPILNDVRSFMGIAP